jgi:hypothetical protein
MMPDEYIKIDKDNPKSEKEEMMIDLIKSLTREANDFTDYLSEKETYNNHDVMLILIYGILGFTNNSILNIVDHLRSVGFDKEYLIKIIQEIKNTSNQYLKGMLKHVNDMRED